MSVAGAAAGEISDASGALAERETTATDEVMASKIDYGDGTAGGQTCVLEDASTAAGEAGTATDDTIAVNSAVPDYPTILDSTNTTINTQDFKSTTTENSTADSLFEALETINLPSTTTKKYINKQGVFLQTQSSLWKAMSDEDKAPYFALAI